MSEFKIKECRDQDLVRFAELCSKLYRTAIPSLSNEEDHIKKQRESDLKKGNKFSRLGAYYDDTMYASLTITPFKINFDANVVDMGGIGDVISDHEVPLKGAVKLLFKEAFIKMRENGMYISYLFPFEMNYYRQYGYEVCCDHCEWKIPIYNISPIKNADIRGFDNSEKMRTEIISVYEAFSKNRNISISSQGKNWAAFFEDRKAFITDKFSYVHYENGNADAYICYYTKANNDRMMDLVVSDCWFTSYKALKEILSYFVSQKPYAENVILSLPADVDIAALVECAGGWDRRNTEKFSKPSGQVRVVDVFEVLKVAKIKGFGKVSVKITDDIYCPWNNGCFTVEFGEENKVYKSDDADIEMSINAFSSVISGRYDLDNITAFSDVKIISNEEALKKLFYKKSCWIDTHF